MQPIHTYEEALKACRRALTRSQIELSTELFIKGDIDEVSVLFASNDELMRFVDYAKSVGMDNFNTVYRDTMVQLQGNSEHHVPNMAGPAFDVRFEFLRSPGAVWRIEAMAVLDGKAPLHKRALASAHELGAGRMTLIHVSWKCETPGAYERCKEALANPDQAVSEGRAEPVGAVPLMAEYQNSYGRFSYFGTRVPYLKPRVNLRDG